MAYQLQDDYSAGPSYFSSTGDVGYGNYSSASAIAAPGYGYTTYSSKPIINNPTGNSATTVMSPTPLASPGSAQVLTSSVRSFGVDPNENDPYTGLNNPLVYIAGIGLVFYLMK